jgi:hypothetical protein
MLLPALRSLSPFSTGCLIPKAPAEICQCRAQPTFSGRWQNLIYFGLRPTGIPLEIDEASRWEADTVSLGQGQMLVMYTDGITDAKWSGGILWGGIADGFDPQ